MIGRGLGLEISRRGQGQGRGLDRSRGCARAARADLQSLRMSADDGRRAGPSLRGRVARGRCLRTRAVRAIDSPAAPHLVGRCRALTSAMVADRRQPRPAMPPIARRLGRSKLGADDFDAQDRRRSARSAATRRSARRADPAGARAGRRALRRRDDKVVCAETDGDSFTMFDPLGGEALGSVDVRRSRPDRRSTTALRGVIEARARRAHAVQPRARRPARGRAAIAIKHPTADRRPACTKALAAETDPEVSARR